MIIELHNGKGEMILRGLGFLCAQFGLDETRLKHLLQYVFRLIYARLEDGKTMKEIERELLGPDAEGSY